MRRAITRLVPGLPRYGWLPFVVLLAGCGYPSVEPANREIITSLRTACSSRDTTWLEANVEKIDARRASGELGDDEYEAFDAIVRQARDGDWAGAEAACLKFQRAQRPTPDQVAKIRAFHEE
jgi:hypothetical protein